MTRAATLARRVAAVVGPEHVVSTPARLDAYARDAWPRLFLLAREARLPRPPELVVRPGTVEEVAALVRLCADEQVPLIPYGAGSGVCGGTYPLHGGVALDLGRFGEVGEVDPQDRLVTAGAGVVGQHLEDRLNRQGYTAGHFPSSIYCSTVGGWIAARGAGQMSSRYGKIEDLVSGLVFVDGAGEVHRLDARPRAALGPDPVQLVVGSEGVLGVVTEATLRVRRLPAERLFRGILLPSVDAGIEAMRRIFAAGLRPSVVRLYDPLDSRVNKGKGTATGEPGLLSELVGRAGGLLGGGLRRVLPVDRVTPAATRLALSRPGLLNAAVDRLGRASLLILGCEGPEERVVAHEMRRSTALAIEAGGQDLGAGPGEHWYEHRYAVSYKITPMLELGAFVDTMEVATTWDRLPGLYAAVRAALRDHAFVMAHFSHAYEEGCSIYFTFAGAASDVAGREARYDAAWTAALEAVDAAGATISHHHGIGMSKQGFMGRELGGGMVLLRALKDVCDPAGVMNPGKLGLGDGPSLPGTPWRAGLAS